MLGFCVLYFYFIFLEISFYCVIQLGRKETLSLPQMVWKASSDSYLFTPLDIRDLTELGSLPIPGNCVN